MKFHSYDEEKSYSYMCRNNYTKVLYNGWYKEVALSKEDFYIQNNNNTIQKVEQLYFLLGKKTDSEDKKYEAIIGLRYGSFNDLMDYNLIRNLIRRKIINSYYWFLNLIILRKKKER